MADHRQPDEYDRVTEAREYLEKRLESRPKAAVVLGSGLAPVSNSFEKVAEIEYRQIPHWSAGTVAGHRASFFCTRVSGVPVALLCGRAHLYEGYSPAEVVFAVRVLGTMGVRSLVLTNASGALREGWQPGRLALLADHINLQGANPLLGPNDERFGPRFPDLSEPYNVRYRELAREVAVEQGFELLEGVYAAVLGPHYETPAEVRSLRTMGADMVGMSTAPETIAARHMGIDVLGIAVIANLAAGMEAGGLSHEEVLEASKAATPRLAALLKELIPRMVSRKL